jgi:hypothetical protein
MSLVCQNSIMAFNNIVKTIICAKIFTQICCQYLKAQVRVNIQVKNLPEGPILTDALVR